MNAINLAKRFVKVIEKTKFTKRYKKELDFERDVFSVLREYLRKKINVTEDVLNQKIITHGRNKEEKERWSRSKIRQDVIIAGCHNTCDIVVFLSKKKHDQIAIHIKYAKDNITSPIQTIIGQCLIASLIFPVVIGVVFLRKKIDTKGRINQLINKLKKHRIFIIVKQEKI